MWGAVGIRNDGETEVIAENRPNATWPTTFPRWSAGGVNPGLRGLKPTTNRLSFSYRTRGICVYVFKNKSVLNLNGVCVCV